MSGMSGHHRMYSCEACIVLKHTALLDKDNKVARYLICVTREFKQQTQPLTAANLRLHGPSR